MVIYKVIFANSGEEELFISREKAKDFVDEEMKKYMQLWPGTKITRNKYMKQENIYIFPANVRE